MRPNHLFLAVFTTFLTTTVVGASQGKMPDEARELAGLQDRAYTVEDQQLLIRMRQDVLDLVGANEGWSPVHFIVKRGTATLLGLVATPQERDRVLEAARQTDGVKRIIDGLEVLSERPPKRSAAARPALYASGGITPSGGLTHSEGVTESTGITRGGGITRSQGVTGTGGGGAAGISGSLAGGGTNSGSLAVVGIVTNQPRLDPLTNQPPAGAGTTNSALPSSTNSTSGGTGSAATNSAGTNASNSAR